MTSDNKVKILLNHLGYFQNDPKFAVLKFSKDWEPKPGKIQLFKIVHGKSEFIRSFHYKTPEMIDEWNVGWVVDINFSKINEIGQYFFHDIVNGFYSENFEISSSIDQVLWVSDLLFYFKSQRSSGKFDRADCMISVFGREEEIRDVHGGWFDASGDVSKYLSHLSYANFFNPQQIPLVVWNLLKSYECFDMKEQNIAHEKLKERMLEEAVFGADFLVRMQNEEGAFYQTVFDQWSKDVHKRVLCSYKTQKGVLLPQVEASWRSGGGFAIAALAKVYQLKGVGDFSTEKYLIAAEKGFAHLKLNHLKYLPDGEENIIDDYCSLIASIELFRITRQWEYLEFCRIKAQNFKLFRVEENDGFWLSANREMSRPFSHASDEGMPIIALLEYLSIEVNEEFKKPIVKLLEHIATVYVKNTESVHNPFGLVRQLAQDVNGEKRSSFFMLHENETGYWWQGENARLASIASAFDKLADFLGEDHHLHSSLKNYSMRQLDWILGLNPFDSCMWYGKGKNNLDYQEGYPNASGGICNGITSGYFNEKGIDFAPQIAEAETSFQRWRWREQWLPHAAWFLLLISQKKAR